MSNHKELIEQLSESIKVLEEQAADMQIKAFQQRELREQTIASMIVDEEMLSDTNWEIRLDGNSAPFLDLKDNPEEGSPMESIEKLVKKDYRSWVELSDGIKLQFDDGDVTILFKEPKQLLPFIVKNKLRVTGSGILDQLARLKREVSALEAVCHQFNIQ